MSELTKPMRVIFAECSHSFWVQVAAYLAEQYQWEPIYWIASSAHQKAIQDQFPNIIFHATLDAIKGIPSPQCADLQSSPIDQEVLASMAFHESIALKMMDRMDPNFSFGYQDRIRLYHSHLMYWSGIIKELSPDVVVFPTSPHVVYDYILYSLCKKHQIKTMTFERTSLPGLIFPINSFEKGSEQIQKVYQSDIKNDDATPINLSEVAENHLKKMTGNYSEAIPFYLKNSLTKSNKNENFANISFKNSSSKKAFRSRLTAFKRYVKLMFGTAPKNYLKQPDKAIENSSMTGRQWLKNKLVGNMKKKKLRQLYERLATGIDMNQPYIYVSLSYQPERTTSPCGESFAHLNLMIDLLSKTIPQDWYLYVKDHISQFQHYKHGERSRSKIFYKDLSKLENVRLVPLSYSPFELIDRCKAVATVTGTVGWEAVLRGKPALVFGHPWYKPCEGVYYTPTEACCKEAFGEIESGRAIDQRKIRLFVKVLEKVCFKGFVDPRLASHAGVSDSENAIAIAKAIRCFIKTSSI